MALSPRRLNLSIRTRNKAHAPLESYDALFDQLVETDLFDPSNTVNGTYSDDSLTLFDLISSSGVGDNVDSIPRPGHDARHEDACVSWQETVELLRHNASWSEDDETCTGAHDAAALDPELFSLDSHKIKAPASSPLSGAAISPPLSPLAAISATKKRFELPIRTSNATSSSPARKLHRIHTPPTTMLSPAIQRTGFKGTWAKKIEAAADKFSLHIGNSPLPLSPPPSTALPQDTFPLLNSPGIDAARLISPALISPAQIDNHFSPQYPRYVNPRSPGLNNGTVAGDALYQNSNPPQNRIYTALASLHTPPPSGRLTFDPWNLDPHESLDYSYTASPGSLVPKAEEWWSHPGTMQPRASIYQSTLDQLGPAPIGLGLEGIALGTSMPSGMSMEHYNVRPPYDAMPPYFDNTVRTPNRGLRSPFSTSPQFCDPNIVLPSDPVTPSQTLPRQRRHQRNPSRASSPSPSASPRHPRSRSSNHKRSQSQHQRRKSGCKEAGQRPVSAGFVNLTPDDRSKLLTGVAPSGSSKTKARREKEAADRRRRLSEAAQRAIMEAGGDLMALEREGLLRLAET